jgi:hypothetical protein
LYSTIFRQNVGLGFILLAGMISGSLLSWSAKGWGGKPIVASVSPHLPLCGAAKTFPGTSGKGLLIFLWGQ